MVLSVGTKAPTFELRDSKGRKHQLADYAGQTIILYFYPRDNTTDCTTEACSFRDSYQDFRDAGVEVIGISPDTESSHLEFQQEYDLPFILLSDPDHAVCELYGVWGIKTKNGREYESVYRTTYIIDPKGLIKHVFEKVKPTDHSQEVLLAVKE